MQNETKSYQHSISKRFPVGILAEYSPNAEESPDYYYYYLLK